MTKSHEKIKETMSIPHNATLYTERILSSSFDSGSVIITDDNGVEYKHQVQLSNDGVIWNSHGSEITVTDGGNTYFKLDENFAKWTRLKIHNNHVSSTLDIEINTNLVRKKAGY